MIHERGKIKGIIDELVLNSMRARATSIHIDIEELEDSIRIVVEDNGTGMDPDKLDEIRSKLTSGRRDELDTYYGELCGESHAGTGLCLVAMMVDRAEIDSVPGGGTKVTVYRSKADDMR